MTRMTFAVFACWLAAVPACNKAGGGGIPEAAKQEAKMIYETRCTTCHGPRGAGDGPGSAALTPKPRNFQDKAWQGGINDGQIETIIKGGGLAVGKSPAMPPNPDLDAKPQVVAALREYIRSLAQ